MLSGYPLTEGLGEGEAESTFLTSSQAVLMLLSLGKSLDDLNISSNGPREILPLLYYLIPISMNLLTTEANHKEHCYLPVTSEGADVNHGISIKA